MSMTSAGVARRRRALVVALLDAVLGCVLLTTLRSGLALASGWVGTEAAFAVLPEGTLTVLDVRDRVAARRSVAQLPAGTKLAFVRHYAVLGAPAAVDAAVAATARGNTLLGANAYRRAKRR
jgi:hypothetical protein